MKFFKVLAVLAAIGVATPADAAVHKCVDKDGKTTWSDKPCTVYPQGSTPAHSGADGPEAAPEPTPDPLRGPVPAPVAPVAEPEAPASMPETPAPSQPSLEELQIKRKAGWLGIAAALMLVAWVMHIVAAVKLDRIGWAICLFLFSPLSNILFTAFHWQKAKLGFFIYVAGMAVMIWAVVSLYSGLVPT